MDSQNNNQAPQPPINNQPTQQEPSQINLTPPQTLISQQWIPPSTPIPNNIVGTPPEKPSNKRLLIIVTALLSIVLLGTIIGGIYFLTRSTSKQPSLPIASNSAKQTKTSIDTSSLSSAYDDFYKSGVKEFTPGMKQKTLDGVKKLTTGFSIKSDFFKDTPSSLIALGIARLYTDDLSHEVGYRNQMYLLASTSITELPSGITDEYFTADKQTDTDTLNIFSKYTDTDTTKRFNDALSSSGVSAEVSKNLGLASTTDLTPYTAIVMNFDSGSDQQKTFAKEHYMFGADPRMWVEGVGSKAYILLPKNYAQGFIDNPQGNERSVISHELVHTQNAFVRGGLGRSIEERRAEYFSGDHSAYFDAKQLFIYTEVFSGVSLNDLLKQHPVDPAGFYTSMYAKLGLVAADKITTSMPSAFLGQPSTAVKNTVALDDNMNGAIQAVITLGKKDQATMDKRMADRVAFLLTVFKTKQKILSDIDNNLSQNYGMPAAAKEMTDYINSH